MYKLTPKYGIYKQFEYRDEVIKRIKLRYNKNYHLKVTSLGGQFCFINPNSIENQILKYFKNAEITIVETSSQSLRVIHKSLSILNRYNRNDKKRVKIFDGTMRKYIKNINKYKFSYHDKDKCNVVIADYYSGFNRQRIEELNYFLKLFVLSKYSQIFLTIAEAHRVKTKPITKFVKSESKDKNYLKGVINIIQKIAKKNESKLESQIESWGYKNKDVSKHATQMHVLDIKVA